MNHQKTLVEPENKPFEYFKHYQKGLSISEIAKLYGVNPQSIRYHLDKNPKFEPPGKGNRTQGKKRSTRSGRREENRVIDTHILKTLYLPPELLEQVDRLPGTFVSKVIAGLNLLLEREIS
jgi:predicted transcriptional regulator